MDRLALLDFDYFPYVVCHLKNLKDDSGEYIVDKDGNNIKEVKSLEDKIKQTEDIISFILTKTECSKFIGALSTVSFRKNEFKEYKSNREGKEKPEHFREIIDYLKESYDPIIADGYEADDILLSLRNQLSNEYTPIICCNDKDISNLVKVFNIRTFEYTEDKSSFDAHYNFWKQMLIGDSTDGVKGVPKIGEVRAKKILNSCNDTFNTLIEETLSQYISYYGEYTGVCEFYKNYRMLKIIDNLQISNYKINNR